MKCFQLQPIEQVCLPQLPNSAVEVGKQPEVVFNE